MDSMLKRRVASFARNFGYEDLDEASKLILTVHIFRFFF